MPKSGGKRKKTRTHVEDAKNKDEFDEAPKAFIIKRGKVGMFV
jgi:ribosome biogenesis protein SSF1/2